MIYQVNEETGATAYFRHIIQGWREATQEEIDEYLLNQAKRAKIVELDSDKMDFCALGFVYGENTFTICGEAKGNLTFKNSLGVESVDRYKYYDSSDIQIDFVDEDGWVAFFTPISQEIDRIIRYDLSKKREINSAATISEVEDITINFSP